MTKINNLPDLYILIKNGQLLLTMNGIGKKYDYLQYIKKNYENPYADYIRLTKLMDDYVPYYIRSNLKKATQSQKIDIPILNAIVDFFKIEDSNINDIGPYLCAYAQNFGVKGLGKPTCKVNIKYELNKRDFVFDYNFARSRPLLSDVKTMNRIELLSLHEIEYAKRIGFKQKIKMYYEKKSIQFKYLMKNNKEKREEVRRNLQNIKLYRDRAENVKEYYFDDREKDDTIEYSKKSLGNINIGKNITLEKTYGEKRNYFNLVFFDCQENRDVLEKGFDTILKYAKDNKEEIRKNSKIIYEDVNSGRLTKCLENLVGNNGIIFNKEELFKSTPEQFFVASNKANIGKDMSYHDKEIIYYVILQKLLIDKVKNKKDLDIEMANSSEGLVRKLKTGEVAILER